MRAVNLIPQDARPGSRGRGGRSNGVVYVLLGGLAVLVAMVSLWTLAGRDLSHGRTELDQLRRQAAQAQSRASSVATFSTFATLRSARVATVRELASSRFDWARTLDAIARILPPGVRLASLSGTLPGAAATTSAAAAPVPTDGTAPAIQISGCAPSQASVAKLMPRLRAVPGVATVTLGSSTGAGLGGPAAGGAAAAASPVAGCPRASFQMGLSFAGAPGTTAVAPAAGATSTTAVAPAAGATSTTAVAPAAGATSTTAVAPAAGATSTASPGGAQ